MEKAKTPHDCQYLENNMFEYIGKDTYEREEYICDGCCKLPIKDRGIGWSNKKIFLTSQSRAITI